MCGIFGYIGKRSAANIVLKGLKTLEYRGYDSWGIAVKTNDGKIKISKEIGKIGNNTSDDDGNIAIGHTRWATHGKVTRDNAHPHTSCNGEIVVVHNGIIENYQELRSRLLNHKFVSQTDTEVIAHLIEEKMNKKIKFELAVEETLNELEGTFALCIMHEKENIIMVARKGSPLVIGIGNKEFFIASDVTPFLEYTKKVLYLDDNEVALITTDIKVKNAMTKKIVKREIKTIDWNYDESQLGDYEHYMLKEINEQPKAIKDTMEGRIKQNKIIFNELNITDTEIKKISRIIVVACGTSYHGGITGKYMFEEMAKIQFSVEYASEFRYSNPVVNKDTLIIAITQSGETADTLAALREGKKKGAKVIAICNVTGSTIARESDYVIYTRAGPEIGVASTKAFTTQVTILYLLANYFAQVKGTLTTKELENNIKGIQKIPDLITQIMKEEKEIIKIAGKYQTKSNFLYLGRGPNYPIALEGALKLKEISYIHAEGQSAAEMKHGPIALIDNNMPTVFIAVNDKTRSKIVGNMEEVKSRGGIIIAVISKGEVEIKKLADHTITVPETLDLLQPIITVVPLQLLAYYIANFRECDIDKPRNLAKSVTVE